MSTNSSLKFANKVIFLNQSIGVTNLAADPVSPAPVAGDVYWNTTSLALRYYNGSTWQPLASGSSGLTGQSLPEYDIIIGNASNLSAQVSTSQSSSNITADPVNGLLIKSGVITDAMVAVGAAIEYSKLAALGGATNEILIQNSSGYVAPSSILSTNLLLADGSVPLTASWNAGGTFFIYGLPTPTSSSSPSQAATKAYVDASITGLSWKGAVVVATAAALPAYTFAAGVGGADTLTATALAALTVDGVAVATGNRILVKNETSGNAPYNGLYVVTNPGSGTAAYVLTRATDMQNWAEVPSAAVFAEEGTVNAASSWVCSSQPGGTFDTTAITFVQFSGSGTYTAGNGLLLTGSQFSVKSADSSISETSSGVAVVEDPAGAIITGVSGIKSQVLSTGGIQINSNSLALLLADASLATSSLGAKVVEDPAGAIITGVSGIKSQVLSTGGIQINSNSLALLLADASLATSSLGAKVQLNASSALSTTVSGLQVQTDGTTIDINGSNQLAVIIPYANNTLSNLGTTAINASLVPNADGTLNLGSATDNWLHVYTLNVIGSSNLLVEASSGLLTLSSGASSNIAINSQADVVISATSVRRESGIGGLDSVVEQFLPAITLAANTSTPTAINSLGFTQVEYSGVIIDYVITQATTGDVRCGKFIISADVNNNVGYSDSYSESNGDIGIVLSASSTAGTVTVFYTNSNVTDASTMHADVKWLPTS